MVKCRLWNGEVITRPFVRCENAEPFALKGDSGVKYHFLNTREELGGVPLHVIST